MTTGHFSLVAGSASSSSRLLNSARRGETAVPSDEMHARMACRRCGEGSQSALTWMSEEWDAIAVM